MTSLEEFNSSYQNFLELYGQCTALIAKGVELESSSCNEVSLVVTASIWIPTQLYLSAGFGSIQTSN